MDRHPKDRHPIDSTLQTRQSIDTTINRHNNLQTDKKQTGQLIDRQGIDSIRQLIDTPRQEIDKTTYRQTIKRQPNLSGLSARTSDLDKVGDYNMLIQYQNQLLY